MKGIILAGRWAFASTGIAGFASPGFAAVSRGCCCAGGRNHTMNLQKILPVATSIGIILLVAVLRERSRTLAAIFATMPINMPLAIWVVASGVGDEQLNPVIALLTRNMLIGFIPTFVWLGIVFLAMRAGWQLIPAILTGYAVWAVLIAAAFAIGLMEWPR